jgi:fructokinase
MILVAGENLIDLIQTGTGADGAPQFEARAGGSPYNCARALARLGAPVGYLTPISTDAMGDLLADGLRGDGAVLLGGRSARPASLALVTLDGGEPRYRFYRDRTADRDVTAAGLRRALPEGAAALHVGSMALMDGPDAEALAELFEHAAGRGLLTAIDPNIRAAQLPPADVTAYRARLERLFAAARIVKLSAEDLRWLSPGAPPETAAEALMAEVCARASGRHAGRGGRAGLARAVAPEHSGRAGGAAGRHGRRGRYVHGRVAGGPSRCRRAVTGGAGGSHGPRLRAILDRAARAAAITCGRRGCNPPTRADLDAGA